MQNGTMQIIIIDGQLCPWKDISSPAPRKEKKALRQATFVIKNNIYIFCGYKNRPKPTTAFKMT